MDEPSAMRKETMFKVDVVPFAHTERLINQGNEARIDPKQLAAEIREHGVKSMPDSVAKFLCRHLEGTIEKRGRHGHTPFERIMMGRQYHLTYRLVRLAQAGKADTYPDIVHFYENSVEGSYSRSEAAWRLVSIYFYGIDGHHKKIKNAAGARNRTKVT